MRNAKDYRKKFLMKIEKKTKSYGIVCIFVEKDYFQNIYY